MPLSNPPVAAAGSGGVTVDADGFFSFAGSDGLPQKVVKIILPDGTTRYAMKIKDGNTQVTFHRIDPEVV